MITRPPIKSDRPPVHSGRMHSAQESTEPAAVSPWMDAAFALDELHSDPHFGELKALVDELQRRKVLASDGPDSETISAFLDEMELLDMEIAMPQEELEMSMRYQSPEPLAASPPLPRPSRKKKISSTERRKREKATLLDSIDQLQLQLEGAMVKKQQLHADWRHRAQDERCDREHSVLEHVKIRRALALEQSYAGTVALLLHQLNASMQVHCLVVFVYVAVYVLTLCVCVAPDLQRALH